ncbi:Ltp family lipoprotein [Acinetobacter sp. CS-2]|uniref:Ltp family lipoprotein n=1 Tax=Acinetobacter sp. CS-2 TaxID=2798861 RepID=UPI002233F231|nr:Ltp family lipoprotein [Acinetobacter sp. CS-2]
MSFINGLFAILTLVLFILLIIGLIKPSVVKMKTRGKAFLVFFVGMIISSLIFDATMSDEEKAQAQAAAVKDAEKEKAVEVQEEVSEVLTQAETKQEELPAEPVGESLTRPQLNAVRSAENYLSFTGFSRDGLIQQLSSSAGDGYDVADATVAVDSLNVDWNEQAVRSAKQYLELTGFSCSGLVEQLSSSAGSKYTVDQARYGAQQAGACS